MVNPNVDGYTTNPNQRKMVLKPKKKTTTYWKLKEY